MNLQRKRYNTFIEKEKYFEVFDSQGVNSFLIDKEDKNTIEQFYWYKNDIGYWLAYSPNGTIRLHRFLLGVTDNSIFVDHKDRNKSNNLKNNLRLVTQQQNNFNKNPPNTNTSGFIGVYYDKKCHTWRAQIKINHKVIPLGKFSDIEQAISVRLKAEIFYFGEEYSPQRHLFNQYNINKEATKDA